MDQIELDERRYCALRIAEYLETNMLSQEYKDKKKESEEKIHVENFLNPQISEMKLGSIKHWKLFTLLSFCSTYKKCKLNSTIFAVLHYLVQFLNYGSHNLFVSDTLLQKHDF